MPVLALVRVLMSVRSYHRCSPYLKQQKQHNAVPKMKTPTDGMVIVYVFMSGSMSAHNPKTTHTVRGGLHAHPKHISAVQLRSLSIS